MQTAEKHIEERKASLPQDNNINLFPLLPLSCLLFTEMAKYTIGRLRPHFLSVCDPELTDQLCKDSQGYMKFVELDNEELICRGKANL